MLTAEEHDRQEDQKQVAELVEKKGILQENVLEIGEICKFLQLSCLIEARKAYPRDWIHPGRVKVQLFKENGDPTNPQVKSKNEFLLKLGEPIPKLKSRAAPVTTTTEQTQGGGGGRKKKGRR